VDLVARGATFTENALVARMRHGDDAAYEKLVRVYGPRMLAVARRYFPRQEDAEDVLQSAFLLVFRFIHRFEGNSQLSTWLHRIVVNSALMRIRSRNRHHEERLSVSACEDHYEAELSTHLGSAGLEELVQRETQARLLLAVGRLPDMVRAAVRLRDVDGLTLDETSLLLGRSVTPVRTAVQRGRIALRTMLAPIPGQADSEPEHGRLPSAPVLEGDGRRVGHRTMLAAMTALHVPRLDAPVLRARAPGDTTTAKRNAVVVSDATFHRIQPLRSLPT
jgi:RNA polymerase sigma-70 factor (ECF subfamily)